MRRYSIESKDWIFVKGYRFLSSAKNTRRNIGKNISKTLKLLDHAKKSKQFATDALKSAPKRAIQETTEATGDLIKRIK